MPHRLRFMKHRARALQRTWLHEKKESWRFCHTSTPLTHGLAKYDEPAVEALI